MYISYKKSFEQRKREEKQQKQHEKDVFEHNESVFNFGMFKFFCLLNFKTPF